MRRKQKADNFKSDMATVKRAKKKRNENKCQKSKRNFVYNNNFSGVNRNIVFASYNEVQVFVTTSPTLLLIILVTSIITEFWVSVLCLH